MIRKAICTLKKILINLINNEFYEFCYEYLTQTLLANALYKFFHYENK